VPASGVWYNRLPRVSEAVEKSESCLQGVDLARSSTPKGLRSTMNSSDWITRLDYSVFMPAAARLPARLAYLLADIRGALVYGARADSRRHALASVRQVFPELSEKEVIRIVRRHYQILSANELEGFWYGHPASSLNRLVRFTGLEELRAAIAAGKGVLLFSGHMGCTGIFFAASGRNGIVMNIIGRSIEPDENPLPPVVLRYNRRRVAWIEEAVSRPFILTGRGKYPEMRAKLQAGELVMMLIDVVPLLLRRVVPVTFLGRTAYFGTGIAGLYLETGAPIFQWTIQRKRQQEVEIRNVTDRVRGLDDQQAIIQALAGLLEEKIRSCPDHWNQWDSLEHFYTPPAEESLHQECRA
jgi:lauroyl/myristoyl acyltransferase